jgi:hypothetical protein
MNVSVLLLLALAISMLMTAVLLLVSIRKNFLKGQSFREQIMEKIESLRFGQMLKKHNVNPQQLVHNTTISKLEMQIRNCGSCLQTAECDRVLSNPIVSSNDLAFCLNHSTIAQQS